MNLFKFFSVSRDIDTIHELEIEKGRTQLMVMKMAALTLSFIMFTVVLAMLIGLYIPSVGIDNNEIFKIIGPAFSMIVGAFVGAFATMMGMKITEHQPNIKAQEMEKTPHKESAKEESNPIDDENKMKAAVKEYEDSDDDFGPF